MEKKLEERERVKKAVSLFEEGYNCCQSVFGAYGELFGLDRDTALKISASFGAGMGRMREVCGTVSGMALVCGLISGATQGKDQQGKQKNYEMVRMLAGKFKEKNGSIICRELLGIKGAEESAKPEERTAEYYKKRPCRQLVACAAEILEETFWSEEQEEKTDKTRR